MDASNKKQPEPTCFALDGPRLALIHPHLRPDPDVDHKLGDAVADAKTMVGAVIGTTFDDSIEANPSF